MKLLVRADASVEIGMGHRVRCQALVSAFEELGWQCQFVMDRRYQAFGSTKDSFVDTEAQFWHVAEQADLVILDHYGYRAADIRRLYQHQPNLLVLDDMNDRGVFPAKWLLNPLSQDYSEQIEWLLTGSQYALLRPAFQRSYHSAGDSLSHVSQPNKLLITLGGTDPLALTLPILKGLLWSGFPKEDIQILLGANAKNADQVIALCNEQAIAYKQGLADVTPLMKQAKMAISAAGGTLFELACMGVPTVFAQVADNQTRSLEQHVPLGWCRAVRFDHVSDALRGQQVAYLVEALNRCWGDLQWQENASEIARRIVDGNGAKRVAKKVSAYFGVF
ncbi:MULTISPECIES: PseG/SpsG family protein [Marinomonas]|uniref:UDP-2,4-diacetamido-2,4, 6-trideoxy-beta-L-altropyranose hydrolase n=1 Tax=Marinomonas arctica TaxID=383750 RepID=A0A7H1J3P1_9GAMM|nr:MULTISPECIES: UDP-2,4-diacetamido-2,4,6-trideoxy-beta-L-altropyranose hydrolase [Marinomonas]MCS7487015.1 spore coat protein [Marinomonas sp. BSi20414]QNT05107.1 UDP-2,4-diacetamido-2,4,6-trideoxy-beta-L-altropyranose hydrolase [Marinomonas arctica]GGN16073.1 UDP-2,4-diacetamido-2,4,6-trideoxy-beta-L-altropyranose hydrolase [Marinomonas arctica]